jgi:DNA-binding GntR family transcriptional regulator
MLSQLHKIPARTDYVEAVYKALLDAISDGSLPPKTRITQEEIAEQMNISRLPVLQALRMLKNDGFVEDAPGRGLQVTALNIEWIDKLYEVRGALDSLAAKLAAQKKCVIDPQLIKHGRTVSEKGDVNALIDADIAFHSAIYDASENPLIAKSAHLHWVHLRRVMGAVLQSSQRSAIWDEHQAIADAIKNGDEKKAAELSELHANRARKNLIHQLEQTLSTN